MSTYTNALTQTGLQTNPSSNTSLLLDPNKYSGSDHQASQLTADLYRAQWQDYLNRFAPVEDKLVNSVMNGTNMNDALAKVNPAVTQQFGLARRDAAQRMQQYGLTPSAEVKQAQDAQLQHSQQATEAALRNKVRQTVQDENNQLMAGASAGASSGG